jgi:peptidoglycan/LPS O-acetylase OafA/YrhL
MKTSDTELRAVPEPVHDVAPQRAEIPGKLPHVPALDGLRGVAVIAVLLSHSGFLWAKGGFLGVTSFFVLSGFLITGLLLAEWDRRGAISLKHFWSRRARRLAPAIPVLLLLVVGYMAWGPHKNQPGVLGDAVASLTWVANWRFIFAGRSYAALFADPSPFQHMWSLAVEEQFYLALPLLTLALLKWRKGAARWWLGGVALAGIAASTWAVAALHPLGAGPGRAYYGTDARVAEPLVGVLLAVLLIAPSGRRVLGDFARGFLDIVGLVGAVGLGLLVYRLTDHTDSLYRGGFLAAAVCTAAMLAAATQPGTVLSRVLATQPLVAIGRVSYGIYLFHWPIFLWLTPRGTGLAPAPLFFVRSAATLGIALLSYAFIERPVRWGRVAGKLAAVGWFDASVGLLAGLVLVTAPVIPSTRKVTTTAASPTATTMPAAAAVAAAQAKAAADAKTHSPTPAAAKSQLSSASKPAATPKSPPGAGAAAVTGGTTDWGTPDKPPAVQPGPDGKMPLKVVVVGDSLANNFAAGLKEWAKSEGDVVVYNLSIPGCPIGAGGGKRRLADGRLFSIHGYCAWWTDTTSDRSQYFAQFDPDIVVMQDSMNEVPDRMTETWSNYRHPGEPDFDNWLLNQYQSAIGTFTGQGAQLLFLNAACADWVAMGGGFVGYDDNNDGDNRVSAVNRTIAAAGTSGVHMGDLYNHICPNGKYASTVDGVDNARPDGYHFSQYGSTALAEKWLGPLIRQVMSGSVLGP